MAAITQLQLTATTGRPYGSFAGKAETLPLTHMSFGAITMLRAGVGAVTLIRAGVGAATWED